MSYRNAWKPTLIAMTIAVAGCGPRVHFRQYGSAPVPRFCDPKTIAKGESVPEGATLLAEVGYGETGFSVSCGVARNRHRLRTKACQIGADAIAIVAENYPNWVSTCYRVRAKLYKLPAADTAALSPVPPQ